MIYFTSDTHFRHKNIVSYQKRPFFSIEEHDDILIQNWNSIVKKGDTVYHLGDFGIDRPEILRGIADKLSGNIFLIKGNHDKSVNKEIFLRRFGWIKDYHELKRDEHNFILFHYPIASWYKKSYGAINLYGHVHGNFINSGKSYDVGVDTNKFKPISIDEVIDKVKYVI